MLLLLFCDLFCVLLSFFILVLNWRCLGLKCNSMLISHPHSHCVSGGLPLAAYYEFSVIMFYPLLISLDTHILTLACEFDTGHLWVSIITVYRLMIQAYDYACSGYGDSVHSKSPHQKDPTRFLEKRGGEWMVQPISLASACRQGQALPGWAPAHRWILMTCFHRFHWVDLGLFLHLDLASHLPLVCMFLWVWFGKMEPQVP